MKDVWDEWIPYVDANPYEQKQNKVVSFSRDDQNFSEASKQQSNPNQATVIPFPSNNSFDDLEKKQKLKNLKQATIIPFPNKKVDSITLQEWLSQGYDTDDLQSLFVNMDVAMKYIHDQGYYISSFALNRIELLNHSLHQVKFDDLASLPLEVPAQKEMVRNNIFLSSVLQIGIYANCLQYFDTSAMAYLKENFEQFATFIPEEDVPYYKGIIERGASVYYSAYVGERKKRELMNLEKELSSTGNQPSKQLVKSSPTIYNAADLIPDNEKENRIIYASISRRANSSMREAAFARALIYPILILILGLSILLLSYLS